MTSPVSSATATPAQVSEAVADAHRREWAYVLAATVRFTRDIDLAEECVQHAYAQALTFWQSRGIPARPGAWLTTVARRRALDLARRDASLVRRLPLLVGEQVGPGADELAIVSADDEHLPDDRLRLIFTCCHPALALDGQVALTLRLLCGLSTVEVARAFLVTRTTMAARLTRAKRKIALAHIPYRVPPAAELPARIDSVLTVIHLVFTTGHTAPAGEDLVRRDLVERSLDLARMLRGLLPDQADVAGLLALILLTDARRATRVDAEGRLVLLQDQDRARWDRAGISEGLALVQEALCRRPPGRFALQAAIAAVHAGSANWDATDWVRVAKLYDQLVAAWPSPVVALNRAVALGLAYGPAEGLAALDRLAENPQLAGYGYLPAARADFLRRLGRSDEARRAYEEALALTENAVERDFLRSRLGQLAARQEAPARRAGS